MVEKSKEKETLKILIRHGTGGDACEYALVVLNNYCK